MYFFFFFQAEDGIRDIGVTGVQTCALPIFVYSRHVVPLPTSTPHPMSSPSHVRRTSFSGALAQGAERHRPVLDVHGGLRSEERRVGKECRSRWSPYH